MFSSTKNLTWTNESGLNFWVLTKFFPRWRVTRTWSSTSSARVWTLASASETSRTSWSFRTKGRCSGSTLTWEIPWPWIENHKQGQILQTCYFNLQLVNQFEIRPSLSSPKLKIHRIVVESNQIGIADGWFFLLSSFLNHSCFGTLKWVTSFRTTSQLENFEPFLAANNRHWEEMLNKILWCKMVTFEGLFLAWLKPTSPFFIHLQLPKL